MSNNGWRHTLRRSLNMRVTLFTLAIFLLCLWSLSFYLNQLIREGIQRQIIEQQASTAELVSMDINSQIEDRLTALSQVAAQLGSSFQDRASLQQRLQQRTELGYLFNGGYFVTDAQGTALASLPESAQRIGVSYTERDYFRRALAEDRPVVGIPVMGKQLHAPIIGLAAPIHGPSGASIGVLAGIVNLEASSFLDKLVSNRYGGSGGYLIVSRSAHVVVTATNKSRVMTPAARAGVSPLIDQFMEGHEGSGLTVNSMGEEVLISARSVPSTDWFLAVSTPYSEASALLHTVQQRMLVSTLLLSAMAAILVWLVLRHQLAPLLTASVKLTQQTQARMELQPLPVRTEDEIGMLIGGFNKLLANLGEREAELRIAATAFESLEGVFVTDPQWVILKVNSAFCRLTGYASEEAIGKLPQALLGSDRQDIAFYDAMTHRLETEGAWQGEVWDRRRDGTIIPIWLNLTALRGPKGEVTHYVATMMDISERKQAEMDIQNLAFFDVLTGLPNRRLLLDRLGQVVTQSLRHQRYGALLFLDLDNFKDLNDTLGHDQGDQLLKQVAARLVTCVRDGDTVARLGGDEFVVMLQDLSAHAPEAIQQAKHIGEKILSALNQAYALSNGTHHSTPSIGVTLFGDKPEQQEELLKRADLAMYQAKAAGRNTLRFFDEEMQAAAAHRASLELALHEALEQEQFELHYQPQVNAHGACNGAEALLRWRHPERGLVPPGEFIPVAESSGLIVAVGQWVLQTACAQLAHWSNDAQCQGLTVSVNVSALQLMQPDFVDQVLDTLRRTEAKPSRLKLELTESMLATDLNSTIEKMLALKAHGVGFSMDDFGTGYSSLTFLKRLPLDQLKIDQSFVRDILIDANDAAIAEMVIALGNTLNLAVIAEGVETEEQRTYLQALGCQAYQGYLFGRPMVAAAFEASMGKDAETLPVT